MSLESDWIILYKYCVSNLDEIVWKEIYGLKLDMFRSLIFLFMYIKIKLGFNGKY